MNLIKLKRVNLCLKIVGSDRVKRGMAEMQKGALLWTLLMQNKLKLQKKLAQLRLWLLERVPSDIRVAGG